MIGGSGADWLFGGQGDDMVLGGPGDDPFITGNLGDDVVFGNLGNDTIYGGQGADTLVGDDGDGSGNGGNDLLFGDRGDDDLYGDFGNDTLVGGTGADRFFFFTGEGVDRIIDFQPGEGDLIGIEIDINGTGVENFAELQPRITGDGLGGSYIDLGDGNAEPFPEGERGGQGTGIGDQGHQRQQGHHRQILHQQHGERGLSVPAGQFPLIPQELDDEGRGRQGKAGAKQEGDRPAGLGQPEIDGNQTRRYDDLPGTKPEQQAPHGPQAPRLHLQPDQEEQEDHAQFGELPDAVDLGGEEGPRRIGTDDDPGHEQAQDRSQAEMAKHGDRDRRDDQQEYGRIDEGFGIHGGPNDNVAARARRSIAPCGNRRRRGILAPWPGPPG